jgi:capsid portal protein
MEAMAMEAESTSRPVARAEAYISNEAIQACQREAARAAKEASNLTDPFLDYYAELMIAEPPVSFSWLAKVYTESGPLQDCIRVMGRNIGGYGVEMQAIGDRGEVDADAAKYESQALITRLEAISDDGTLAKLRFKQRLDLDTYGNAFMEVLRGMDGEVQGLVHARAFTIRIAGKLTEPMEATKYVVDANLGWIKVSYMRRRYTFVQIPYAASYTGGKNEMVYFKEFGDTRIVDRKTGKEDPSTATPAHELLWTSHYHPFYAYGIPLWLGRAAAVLSHTKAGDLNQTSLGRNLMPRVIVSLLNARFDDTSRRAIEQAYQAWCSKANLTAPLIIDAVGADAGTSPYGDTSVGSGAKLQVDTFKDSINEDALFLKGMAEWERSIRSSWGFGPIYLGRAEDLTYASASVHVDLAETQVFAPDRSEEDYTYNQILASWGVRYWRMMTKGCTVSNPESAASLLTIAKDGGATLNEMRKALREYLGIDMPDFGEWGDKLPAIFLVPLLARGMITIDKTGEVTLGSDFEEALSASMKEGEEGEGLPRWIGRVISEAREAALQAERKPCEHKQP